MFYFFFLYLLKPNKLKFLNLWLFLIFKIKKIKFFKKYYIVYNLTETFKRNIMAKHISKDFYYVDKDTVALSFFIYAYFF